MDDPCNGCQRHPDDCDCDLYRELSRIGDRFVADWALDTGPIEAPPAETRRYRGRLHLVAPAAAESTGGTPITGHDPGDEHEDRP